MEKEMAWEITQPIAKEQEKKEEPKIIFKTLGEAKVNRGIKILSYGNFSTGKTHFALTSKKPVFIIDTENGSSPLADKFPDAKVINICSMEGSDLDEKDEVKNFEAFQNVVDYLVALPDNEVGTIIVDSISDIWSWAQAHAKTKTFKIPIEDRFKQQFDWAVPSGMLRKNVQKLINKNCDVIFTAREDEIYEGAGKPAGRYKPNVQKKVPYMVDMVLYHEYKFVNKQIQFQVRIEKCRQKGNLVGKIVELPTMDKIIELLK